MAIPQEYTPKRMTADILISAIHAGRFYIPHYIPQEEKTNAQVKLFEQMYQQLLEAIQAIKIKEVSTKRAAADVLIAFIHNGRFQPADHVSEEERPAEQMRILIQAYQGLINSFSLTKDE
jgi:hypothetical protein